MVKPIVTFRSLADGNVVALCGSHDTMSVNVNKVIEYMSKMREFTGGTEVEFNNTFRQFCKDRVFYTFEPLRMKIELLDEFTKKPFVSEVVECVLLSDDEVAMNVNGTIILKTAEDGNMLYKTKEDAENAAKEDAYDTIDHYIGHLTEGRKELKAELKKFNDAIDTALEFKKSLMK